MVLDGLFIFIKVFYYGFYDYNRSPVLVAMALREAGMNRQESIEFVRTRRRGSFNIRQLEYLQNYHSARRLSDKHAGCVIM
jgi:protein-tyrosine phosphatase